MQRQTYPFRPIRSTAPSFTAGTSNVFVSTSQLFESTGVREWSGPMRSVRLAENAGIDSYVNFGSSTIVAASTNSILLLGNTTEVFHIEPGNTYIAVLSVSTSTGAKVNVTLGYGQ